MIILGDRPARVGHLRLVADGPGKAKPAEVAGDHADYDDGVLRITATSSPPGLVMAGEIDEGTYPALLRKLEHLAGSAEIHIDLGGVEYCDLAGLRAIIQLAGASRGGRGRRRLVLHEVPQYLQTVLGILGWDSTAGLVIEPLAPVLRARRPRGRNARRNAVL